MASTSTAVSTAKTKDAKEHSKTASSSTKPSKGGKEKSKPAKPEKHPLQNKWSLWYFKPDKSKDWGDNLKHVTDFDTVEGFWSVVNHVAPPSKLINGCDYMIFKEGIQPMWEDPRNRQGGRWLLSFERRDNLLTKQQLDVLWEETLMCLVGEIFEDSSDEVCGAVVQVRTKMDKLAIWTGNMEKADDIQKIGHVYREKLQSEAYLPRVPLVFQSHRDTMSKTGSSSKARYTINH